MPYEERRLQNQSWMLLILRLKRMSSLKVLSPTTSLTDVMPSCGTKIKGWRSASEGEALRLNHTHKNTRPDWQSSHMLQTLTHGGVHDQKQNKKVYLACTYSNKESHIHQNHAQWEIAGLVTDWDSCWTKLSHKTLSGKEITDITSLKLLACNRDLTAGPLHPNTLSRSQLEAIKQLLWWVVQQLLNKRIHIKKIQ